MSLLALSLATLLGVSACVSVPPAAPARDRPAAPAPAPAGDRSALPLEERSPGPRKAAKGSEGPRPQRAHQHPSDRAPKGRAPAAPRPSAGRAGPPERAAQRPRTLPRMERPLPQQRQEMRKLCDASEGVADPAVTRVCREAYR